MSGSDAEVAIRMCLQGCKRLDFIHEYEAALFVSSLFNNMSRMQHYVTLLCEEGMYVPCCLVVHFNMLCVVWRFETTVLLTDCHSPI
jgi:hypothetical protein